MTKLVTNNFRVNAAKQLRESITEANTKVNDTSIGNSYYVFLGKHTPWDNEINPDTINQSQSQSFYNVYSNIISGKKVTESDVKHGIRRIPWTTGTVYTMYDDLQDLSTDLYFVVVDDVDGQQSIFKCIDNNGGVASTQKPSIADLGGRVAASNYTGIYQTIGDGYIWKYMYGVSDTIFERFSSTEYIPVEINANVASVAVDGSLDSIKIINSGENYNSFHEGYFEAVAYGGNTQLYLISSNADANNDFYQGSALYVPNIGEVRKIVDYTVVPGSVDAPVNSIRRRGFKRIQLQSAFTNQPQITDNYQIIPAVDITGDGSGAVARAVVNTSSNSISQVIIMNRGSGYTRADVVVTGNSGTISAQSANVRAIVSPPGGHGSDVLNELDASQLIFSVKTSNTENSTISVANDFRTIGLLKDPLFANVKISFVSTSGAMTDGRQVRGVTSGATGIVTDDTNPANFILVTDVKGTFEVGETIKEYTNATSTTPTGTSAVISTIVSHGTRNTVTNGTFKQTSSLTFSYTSALADGTFQEDDYVKQDNGVLLTANGYIQEVTSSTMELSDTKGIWQESEFASKIGEYDGEIKLVSSIPGRAPIGEITGFIGPDLKKNSGEILYIENIQSISRSALQTETINFVIKF